MPHGPSWTSGDVGRTLEQEGPKSIRKVNILRGQTYLTSKLRSVDWVRATVRAQQFEKEMPPDSGKWLNACGGPTRERKLLGTQSEVDKLGVATTDLRLLPVRHISAGISIRHSRICPLGDNVPRQTCAGGVIMQIRSPASNAVLQIYWTLIFVVFLLLGAANAQQPLPDSPSPKTQTKQSQPSVVIAKTQAKAVSENGWPRTFASGTHTFTVYPPQVDKWSENLLDLYCAVELKEGKESAPKYGVVWFQARTEVDKVNRLVTLDQAKLTKVKFPVAQDKEPELTALLEKKLPGATKTISLDRLESEVEADNELVKGVDVKNDPPKVIIASKPSLQVLIDGMPQMREVPGTKLLRVINTRSIILYETDKQLYFLRVQDWWLQTKKLEGSWEYAKKLPDDMKTAEEFIVSQNQVQKPEGEGIKDQPSLKEAGKKAEIPTVYVVYEPAELIETKGAPKYTVIAGTGLEYVANTTGSIFRLGGEYYILISGRWFKGASLDGPWSFVSVTEMPTDFARIPTDDPKATVLASVPGTSQSKESLIANSIPQTATITRSEAKITVKYDGEAKFEPIEGTPMSYAGNTSAAVIKMSDEDYYCVEAGVWFKGRSPQGPWIVADAVPAQIYDIPPSSPLYYVTYAKIYGSTPDVVYVGYTPGYYGTVVSSSTMTVVYGTGWYYPPYISPTAWYGWPYTYGVGAGFTYSDDAGWSFGFGYGYGYYPWYYPWWGPWGYYGCCWYPYYGWGAWGGAVVANVYGVWGNTAYSRTGAAWANPYTGNYGAATRGAYYNTQTGRSTVAGRGYNTNIYTGNTYGYRGGVTYNPNTGIVAGGGAGYVGNIYTGQGAANRGGFIYNTNTNTGIAAGKNNVYAGKDGTVYRYNKDSGNWSVNNGNGWQTVDKPQPKLQKQQEMRNRGAQRTQNFNSMRGSRGARMGGGRRR